MKTTTRVLSGRSLRQHYKRYENEDRDNKRLTRTQEEIDEEVKMMGAVGHKEMIEEGIVT